MRVTAYGYVDTGESSKPYPFADNEDVFTTDKWIENDPGFGNALVPILLAYTVGSMGMSEEHKRNWESWRDGETPVIRRHLPGIWEARNQWHAKQERFLAKHGKCLDDLKASMPYDDFFKLWRDWSDHRKNVYDKVSAALGMKPSEEKVAEHIL